MLHHDSLKKTEEMQAILTDLVRALVLVETENGQGLIALPQQYPGGDAVVVRIRKEGDEFVVNDQGGGYLAAELLGAATTYSRLAPKIAQMHGVSFDGHLMFAAKVTKEWLANTVIFVGTASRQCAEITAQRFTEDVEKTLRQDMQEKVAHAFPQGSVALDVEVVGHSTRSRPFAAMVNIGSRKVLFDLVTPHHVSINSAIVKFQDVAQLEAPPTRNAVLAAEKRTDPADISLLAQWTSSIIKLDAAPGIFQRAA